MSLSLRLFTIGCGLALIISAFHSIVIKSITEKQSLFWLFSGLLIILFGAIPGLPFWLADLFGVEYAPSIIFMIAVILSLFGIYYCFRQIAKLYKRVQELAIQVSLLNYENARLQGKLNRAIQQSSAAEPEPGGGGMEAV